MEITIGNQKHNQTKVTGPQLVKKLPSFYGTRRFLTVVTSVRHLSVSRPYQPPPSPQHPVSWNLNTVLPSTPSPSKWSFSLTFPYQNPVYVPPISLYILHAPSISFLIYSREQYLMRSTVLSIPSQSTYSRNNLIVSFHRRLGLPNALFPSVY